ncbi:hypothetical protein GCM10020255_021380 [Rhodococcus baikonurensis]
MTTQLANDAGVDSVPNILTRVDDWDSLTQQADEAGLGPDLVLQTPYGDSGKTTFFISKRKTGIAMQAI